MTGRDDERWSGPVLVVATAPLVWLFFDQERRTGGFAGLHQYGTHEDGLSWAQHLPPGEAHLYLSLLCLLPVAIAVGIWARSARPGGLLLAALRRHERFIVPACAALATILALGTSHGVLQRTPLTDDEGAYLFHARILASGALTSPSHHVPDRRFYAAVFVVNEGERYSQYPVGNAATLAPGVLLGDPWLVPGVLCGLITLLLAAIARELFGRGSGAGTALCCVSSPFLVASSATLLAHIPCLFWLSLFLYGGLRATRRGGHPAWAALAAAAFGAAVITRPLSSVMLGLPLMVLLATRLRLRARRRGPLLAFLVVGAGMLGLQLWINATCTGHPLRAAYFTYWLGDQGWRSPFGFGEFILGIEHTPRTGLRNQLHNLLRLDAWLLGWPVSLLLPLASPVLYRRGRRPGAVPLLVAAALPLGLYFFFFWPGISDVGPVLYTETMIGWLPLAGAALGRGAVRRRRFFAGMVLTGAVLSLLTFHRVQARELRDLSQAARSIPALVEAQVEDERALVFYNFCVFPEEQQSWVLGPPHPWPDLRDDILYVRDRGPQENRRFARRRHPDRTPYLLVRNCDGTLHLTALPPPR